MRSCEILWGLYKNHNAKRWGRPMHSCEILWGLYREYRAQARHHESQRATMSSLMVAVCAAVLGIIAFDKNVDLADVPLTGFLGFLGIFGALFSAKQYERFLYSDGRAWKCLEALVKKCPLPIDLKDMYRDADASQRRRNPRLYRLRKLRLHWFWIALHVVIALIGLLVTAYAVWSPMGESGI